MKPELGLAPYDQCGTGDGARCDFADAPVITLPGLHPDGRDVSVYRCTRCGMGVTRPALPDVAPLYAGRESQDFQADDGALAKAIKAWVFGRMARAILRRIGPVPRRVVDFACGNAAITRAFARALPDADVVGLDFFDEAPPEIAPARYASFAAHDGARPADLLLCFHALEHDDDPRAFVARLAALVRPGGTMVVEVPNMYCVWTPWFGAACHNWYLPYHRLHFTRSALSALMDGAGMEVLAEQDVCSATIAHSLARALGRDYNLAFFAIGAAFRPVQWLAEKLTRRPSALRIIVRTPA